MTQLPQLRLYQLASANLPVGAFTYSQGLEWATEAGWIRDYDQARDCFSRQLKTSILYCDLPICKRLYEAAKSQNLSEFEFWARQLVSYRESHELRTEELQKGEAFRRFLNSIPDLEKDGVFNAIHHSQLAGMSWYACQQHIDLQSLQFCYVFSWIESSAMAAIKLVPLGHQAGQKLIFELSGLVPELVEQANALSDDELGNSLPMVSIASACHETQYTRLFRS